MATNNNFKTSAIHLLTNKTGIIIGFVAGLTGFLVLFKIVVLNHVPPSDEIAPGIVVLASIMNGVLFAGIARLLQNRVVRKKKQ